MYIIFDPINDASLRIRKKKLTAKFSPVVYVLHVQKSQTYMYFTFTIAISKKKKKKPYFSWLKREKRKKKTDISRFPMILEMYKYYVVTCISNYLPMWFE